MGMHVIHLLQHSLLDTVPSFVPNSLWCQVSDPPKTQEDVVPEVPKLPESFKPSETSKLSESPRRRDSVRMSQVHRRSDVPKQPDVVKLSPILKQSESPKLPPEQPQMQEILKPAPEQPQVVEMTPIAEAPKAHPGRAPSMDSKAEGEWRLPPEDVERANLFFDMLVANKTDIIDGVTAAHFLAKSKLARSDLAEIWFVRDIHQSIYLR